MGKGYYKYIIVGAGLAGTSAIDGIRERDYENPIALFGEEDFLPYDRPPLSKKLWFNKMPLEKVFLHEAKYFEEKRVDLKLCIKVTSLNPIQKTITDSLGHEYGFEKLLLATGGAPRKLSIPGGDLDGVFYYRSLEDYGKLRSQVTAGKRAVIVGGGFIGSELAAALQFNKILVTMIFPNEYLCNRVFPDYLGKAIQEYYLSQGIEILHDKPTSFSKKEDRFFIRTEMGKEVEAEILIVGVGIKPEVELADMAHLSLGDGILLNEFLQTSHPDIYAAGDNASYPSKILGKIVRMEHWDSARAQGRHAGRNMAGASEPYEYLSYFFSDLFDFGYEAVGEIDARLPTRADWQEKNQKGVIYYLDNDKIRGVMLCNVWDKVDAARKLIVSGKSVADKI